MAEYTFVMLPLALLLSLQAPAARPGATAVAPGDWPLPGRDAAATRSSPLDQITPATVRRLQVEWSFSTGSLRGHEGNPLVAAGHLFLQTPHPAAVYAFDLERPGSAPVWRYAPKSRHQPLSGCCDLVSRGMAWHSSGRLFLQLVTGELIALDAKTGRELWRAQVGDPRTGLTTPGAPLVAGDVVVAGVAGGEFGVRGYLSGFDAATGRPLWKAWSTGADADVLLDGSVNPSTPAQQGRDLGLSSWSGDAWQRGGGATAGWFSYDPDLDLLFSGTGAPAPFNPFQRAGDDRWTASLFARDPRTGRARWALQLTPGGALPFDASNESIAADLSIAGRAVRALVHFDQNGFAYTLDRANGRLLLAEKYGPVNWASSVNLTTAQPTADPAWIPTPGRPLSGVCPSVVGLKGFGPAAYSPVTGLFYVPANNLCMDFALEPAGFTPGRPFLGATIRLTPGPGGNRGRFIAWDATRGAVAWEIREGFPIVGGALVTGGGLAFYGTLDGWLKAVDARTGAEVWRFRLPSGVVGSPITYLGPEGKQHLAIVSGVGGWTAPAFLSPLPRGGDPFGVATLLADLPAAVNPGGVLMVFGLQP